MFVNKEGRHLHRHTLNRTVIAPALEKIQTATHISARDNRASYITNALDQLGQEICKTPEQFKAWSQNLGHEKVLTTFLSYGEVAGKRQGEIIRRLAKPDRTAPTDAEEIAEAVLKKLRDGA